MNLQKMHIFFVYAKYFFLFVNLFNLQTRFDVILTIEEFPIIYKLLDRKRDFYSIEYRTLKRREIRTKKKLGTNIKGQVFFFFYKAVLSIGDVHLLWE